MTLESVHGSYGRLIVLGLVLLALGIDSPCCCNERDEKETAMGWFMLLITTGRKVQEGWKVEIAGDKNGPRPAKSTTTGTEYAKKGDNSFNAADALPPPCSQQINTNTTSPTNQHNRSIKKTHAHTHTRVGSINGSTNTNTL